MTQLGHQLAGREGASPGFSESVCASQMELLKALLLGGVEMRRVKRVTGVGRMLNKRLAAPLLFVPVAQLGAPVDRNHAFFVFPWPLEPS